MRKLLKINTLEHLARVYVNHILPKALKRTQTEEIDEINEEEEDLEGYPCE